MRRSKSTIARTALGCRCVSRSDWSVVETSRLRSKSPLNARCKAALSSQPHMAVIGWHNKPDSWVVAGWAFRQVLEDVRSQRPTDPEMISELELARDLKYLFIDDFSPDLAKRLADAIRDTATGILSGTIRSGLLDKSYGDANAIAEYRRALPELIAIVSEHAV